jgi:hypothetical protein
LIKGGRTKMFNVYEVEKLLEQKRWEHKKMMKHEWKFYSNYSDVNIFNKKKQSKRVEKVSPCCV